MKLFPCRTRDQPESWDGVAVGNLGFEVEGKFSAAEMRQDIHSFTEIDIGPSTSTSVGYGVEILVMNRGFMTGLDYSPCI